MAGSAAAMPLATKDQQQPAKGDIGHNPAQAGQQPLPGCRQRPADADPRKGGRRSDQQQGRQDPAEPGNAFVQRAGQQCRQGGGKDHAEQPETFAGRGQAGAQRRIDSDIRPPGLIGNGSGGEAEISQGQRSEQPRRGLPGRRVEQGNETEPEGQQGQPHHAPPRDPVGQPAQPGIDAGIEQAGAEQDETEQRQLHARRFGVIARHMDVDRQGGEGERQAKQAVGEDAGGGHGGARRGRPQGWHHPTRCSKAALSSGALVFGSSQMAKNACAKAGSSILPSRRPLK